MSRPNPGCMRLKGIIVEWRNNDDVEQRPYKTKTRNTLQMLIIYCSHDYNVFQ